MKDVPIFVGIFACFMCSLIFYSIGKINGAIDQREASRKNLIELKMAHYEVNSTTGETTFTLHTPKKD